MDVGDHFPFYGRSSRLGLTAWLPCHSRMEMTEALAVTLLIKMEILWLKYINWNGIEANVYLPEDGFVNLRVEGTTAKAFLISKFCNVLVDFEYFENMKML